VRKVVILLLILAASGTLIHAQSPPVSESGEKLKKAYLAMDVEHLWQAGAHIDWETGRPDDPTATYGVKTHCSAFIAALCERQGIYILRPPQHKQELLANAQYDWLASAEAASKGWHPITGANIYQRAQQYANQGHVVVAVYKNPDAHEPGHIAAVMPSPVPPDELASDGPKLISASAHNYNFTTLRAAFRRHITEWPATAILFYYNEKRMQ
jgi:hypothetical protein